MNTCYDTVKACTINIWTSNDHLKLNWPSGRLFFWNIGCKT